MISESETSATRHVPSLVNLCQRVASAHVENMCSLGDNMSTNLIRPILQNCSADVLARFELASPEICSETPPMWKTLCFRSFALTAEQHFATNEPQCWREAYFRLREFEKERLDAIAAKLRIKREEERKRKEDTQIRYTDKLPPPKRLRTSGWGQTQPKTLFQKTRLDAARLQKGIYAARANPLIPSLKTLSASTPFVSASKAPPTASASSTISPSGHTSGTRVTVTSVPRNQPPSVKAPHGSSRSQAHTVGNLSLGSLNLASIPERVNQVPQPSRMPVDRRAFLPSARKNPTASQLVPASKPRGPIFAPTSASSTRSRA